MAQRASSRLVLFAPLLMQSALALEPEEPRVLVVHARFEPVRRVHVADRNVAFVPQRVIGKIVFLQVGPHVAVAPVGEWVQLPATVMQLQERRVGTAARLRTADTGNPGARTQLAQRA